MPQDELPKDGHGAIVYHMRRLGYKTNKKGVCVGIACMAAQSILTDELDRFLSATYLICKQKQLSHFDNFTSDILPILDGIQLYQSPHRTPHLFDRAIPNQINRIAAIVSTSSSNKDDGIHHVNTRLGIYTPTELANYLASLKELQLIAGPDHPLAFILSSKKHAICLSYHLKCKHWQLIDANLLPDTHKTTNHYNLSQQVLHSFFYSHPNPTITLTTEIASLAPFKINMECFMHEWSKTHLYTLSHHTQPLKARVIDSKFGNSLLHLAIEHRNIKLIRQLLLNGANPFLARKKDRDTPYKLAVNTRDHRILALLHNASKPIPYRLNFSRDAKNHAQWRP